MPSGNKLSSLFMASTASLPEQAVRILIHSKHAANGKFIDLILIIWHEINVWFNSPYPAIIVLCFRTLSLPTPSFFVIKIGFS